MDSTYSYLQRSPNCHSCKQLKRQATVSLQSNMIQSALYSSLFHRAQKPPAPHGPQSSPHAFFLAQSPLGQTVAGTGRRGGICICNLAPTISGGERDAAPYPSAVKQDLDPVLHLRSVLWRRLIVCIFPLIAAFL